MLAAADRSRAPLRHRPPPRPPPLGRRLGKARFAARLRSRSPPDAAWRESLVRDAPPRLHERTELRVRARWWRRSRRAGRPRVIRADRGAPQVRVRRPAGTSSGCSAPSIVGWFSPTPSSCGRRTRRAPSIGVSSWSTRGRLWSRCPCRGVCRVERQLNVLTYTQSPDAARCRACSCRRASTEVRLPTPTGPVAKMLYPAISASSPNESASFARPWPTVPSSGSTSSVRSEAKHVGSVGSPQRACVELYGAGSLGHRSAAYFAGVHRIMTS